MNNNKTLSVFMRKASKQRVTINDLGDQTCEQRTTRIEENFMKINGIRMF